MRMALLYPENSTFEFDRIRNAAFLNYSSSWPNSDKRWSKGVNSSVAAEVASRIGSCLFLMRMREVVLEISSLTFPP